MEKKTLFVDTSAWFALADGSDQYHDRATEVFPELLRSNHNLVTTNLVVAETYILIRRSLGHRAAITFLESIAASPRIVKIFSDRSLEEEAMEVLRAYQDQLFSYTDAVSFSVMKQKRIQTAFTFDQHFATAGFTIAP